MKGIEFMKLYRLFALMTVALCALAFVLSAHAQEYTVTTISNSIVVTDVAGNGDVLTISEPGAGTILFAAPGRLFRVNAGTITTNNSGVLVRTNANSITINAGAGADTINVGAFTGTLPRLTVNGGPGDDTVNFSGDITFAANANLDVDLQNDPGTQGADAVQLLSDANLLASGSGTITVKCSQSVYLEPGSSLETVNGNLTVEANQQATPTSGNFTGIRVSVALIRCTGTGQVNVNGRGGDNATGGQLGILVVDAGQIIGGTTGGLAVNGTGGASTNWLNRGVTVYGAGARISSLGGPVQVTGFSGSVGSYYGIGVALLFGGVISAGGTGSVTVEGTGAGFGGFNQGIELGVTNSAITSGGGDIQVLGIAGPGGSFGIYVWLSSGITNSGLGGNIALISDSIYIENNAGIGAAGNVTLKPRNNAVPIDLGGDDTGTQLGLTDEEIDRITAGTIIIGGTNSGPITVTVPISPAHASALKLISGGIISDSDAAGTDVVIASLTTSGNLAPGASPGIFSVTGDHTLAANSIFTVEIGGTTPGTQHDQLSVSGSMEIGTNVTLNLVSFGGFVPGVGQSFTIISRGDGGGLFAGLPQGATLPNFLGSGLNARLTYAGGAGDDVVIAMLAPEIVVEQPEGTNLADGVILDQYAATIINYSSAYGGLSGGWGAEQVLGVPDTFAYGDIPTSWSGSVVDGTLEFITVGFAVPISAIGATVRETWANGFVYQIDALDTNDVLHTVWSGIDPSPPGSPADFLITWPQTPYLVKGLKVYVDTDHVIGEWEEIDSIQLHGAGNSPVHFGAVNLGGNSNLTFTIRNTGSADLTGLGITIDGAHAGDFAVTASPTAPVSGPSGTTTFTVTFTPAGGAARSAALHIASNDGDENPFDIVIAGEGIPPVAIVTNGITIASENCGTPNGRLDPNETVTLLFSLKNTGFDIASNVTATLQASGGVTAPSGAQSYGTLPPNGSAARPFTFTANAPCGGTVTATLLIQTNGTTYGIAICNFPLGTTETILSENFDAVSVPALPGGWTSSASAGRLPWITSSAESDSPTNSAFSPNSASAGVSELVSPVIEIQSPTARLTFHQIYGLHRNLDGGVLEIKLGGGSFVDILDAGGSFTGGGYTASMTTNVNHPLTGRNAWSGDGGEGPASFTTTVNLPPSAAGQSIQLRWLRGAATNVTSLGWHVDTIAISDLTCCITAPLTITCPGDIVTNAPNVTDGVIVAWPDPVATGTPAPAVSCVPPSGSVFAAGVTTVTCTATNIQGVNSCTFSITICPAYIKVTSVEDSGPGSLRQAIADLCPGGTIEFDPALAGATITLTNGEIVITNDMTIRGLGADQLTLSGNNSGRIFRVGEVTLNLSHLTLTGGRAINASSGGAILNDGHLTLTSCALENNFATGYGGALAGGTRANSCTISNCTFNGNTAVRGGGAMLAGVILPPASVTYEMLGRASAYS